MSSSSSYDSGESVSNKKLKIDPDFTPRKYVKVKENLAIEQNTNKRIYSLNLQLQEKIVLLEKRNELLEEDKKQLIKRNGDLETKILKLQSKPLRRILCNIYLVVIIL